MHRNFLLGICFLLLSACKNELPKSTNQTSSHVQAEPLAVEANEDMLDESGIPAFLDVDLKGYQTEDINLKKHFGEVMFINFWGSWCPPCRMEMPNIQELYNDYGDKVKFAMIAYEKVPGKHIEFVEENGYNFPVYEAVSPMDSELKPQGFPTTIIIDKKGNMLIKDIGAKDWNAQEVREKLDALLEE